LIGIKFEFSILCFIKEIKEGESGYFAKTFFICLKGRLIIESGKGDCKKKSIIVAAMYRIVGIPAKVVWLHQQDSGMDSNHVAVKRCNEAVPSGDKPTAVKVFYPTNAPSCDAGGWEWVETTLPGAKVGNDPYQELERLGPNTGRTKL
jgi:transglutaminase-like putative cysteine protease